MRFALILGTVGLVFAGMPAMAQTAPVYGQSSGRTAAVPFYNNNARPLPMEQMVAGKNAPSYNFDSSVQPYNMNTSNGTGAGGVLSNEQVSQMRAARDARAQQYQQDYMNKVAQSEQGQGVAGAVGNAYNSLTPAPQEKPRPTKKRLVYRESANPLTAPPRLFNID